MAYRGSIKVVRDITTKSLYGQTSLNAAKAQLPRCHNLKCAWQRFEHSPTGVRLKLWCQKMNQHFNFLTILFAKQCNLVAAQRLRRGAQILNLYSRIYDRQSMTKVVAGTGRHGERKSLSLLLGAVLFAWDQHNITDTSIDESVEELTSLFRGDLGPKQQLKWNLRRNQGWEVVMNRDNLSAWRKPIPESYLYEYKVFGSFNDVPARAFFNVQTDLEYRKQWDKLVIHLDVVDKDEASGSEVIRWVTHFPYPMYSREYVFIRRYKVDHDKKVMVFMSMGTDHPECPMTDQYVRVHQYKSNMVIRPHTKASFDENGFDYILTYYDDPQAAIPSAAIKWMASTGVPDFVDKLHDAAKQLAESGKSDTYGATAQEDKLAM